MPSKQGTSTQRRKKGGKFLPALCNVVGTLLLVAVIALCVPLTVPMIMGYQVFDIVSGSMEPARTNTGMLSSGASTVTSRPPA